MTDSATGTKVGSTRMYKAYFYEENARAGAVVDVVLRQEERVSRQSSPQLLHDDIRHSPCISKPRAIYAAPTLRTLRLPSVRDPPFPLNNEFGKAEG